MSRIGCSQKLRKAEKKEKTQIVIPIPVCNCVAQNKINAKAEYANSLLLVECVL
jgi:hypothetical protein